jgi:hypothetical protein
VPRDLTFSASSCGVPKRVGPTKRDSRTTRDSFDDKSESRPELCCATTGGSLPPQLVPIL